jgi:hypothetical protein
MNAVGRLRVHWPEYLVEAGELALYMFFACAFATLLRWHALWIYFIAPTLGMLAAAEVFL